MNLLALAVLLLLPALPLVRRITPVEPSPLKLGLFGALLSPAWVLAVERVADALLPSTWVVPACWGALASGLLLGGRAPRRAPLGRAAWLAIGIALLAGVGLAAWLLRGAAPRTAHDGLMRTLGAAQVLLESGRAEDPWLAGAPLGVETLQVHALAALSRLSGVGVAGCAVALGLWSIVTALVTIHLHSAVLWRDGRADLAAPLLALVGVGALAGFGPGFDASGGWAVALARGVGGAPGEVLHSGMVWLRGGPTPVALALAWGGLYAASHALRHGHAPWPLLTGACLALAVAWLPAIGLTVSAAVLLSALLAADAGARRPGSWGALLLPLLPAVLYAGPLGLAGVAGRVLTPEPGRASWLAFMPLVVLGLGASLRARTLLGPRADLRILLLLAVTAAVLALATGSWVAAAGGDAAGAQAAAVAPLAVLGAGLLARGESEGARSRGAAILASVLVGATLAGGLRHLWLSAPVHERLARTPSGLETSAGRLTLAHADERQRAVEQAHTLASRSAALALRLTGDEGRVPPSPGLSPRGLVVGRALVVDPLARQVLIEESTQRAERLGELLAGRLRPGIDVASWLGVPGRDVVVVVDDLDRERAHPGLDPELHRQLDEQLLGLGLERAAESGSAVAFLWRAAE